MRKKSFCFIVLGAIIQGIGVALLKNGMEEATINLFHRIPGVILMISGFPLYTVGLKSSKLSVAQPLFSTTLFLVGTLLSVLIFHETIRMNQIIGIIVILGGVFCIVSANEEKRVPDI